jgi:hypothetical protein
MPGSMPPGADEWSNSDGPLSGRIMAGCPVPSGCGVPTLDACQADTSRPSASLVIPRSPMDSWRHMCRACAAPWSDRRRWRIPADRGEARRRLSSPGPATRLYPLKFPATDPRLQVFTQMVHLMGQCFGGSAEATRANLPARRCLVDVDSAGPASWRGSERRDRSVVPAPVVPALDDGGTRRPVAPGAKSSEGPASSRERPQIAYTFRGEPSSQVSRVTGDLVESGSTEVSRGEVGQLGRLRAAVSGPGIVHDLRVCSEKPLQPLKGAAGLSPGRQPLSLPTTFVQCTGLSPCDSGVSLLQSGSVAWRREPGVPRTTPPWSSTASSRGPAPPIPERLPWT